MPRSARSVLGNLEFEVNKRIADTVDVKLGHEISEIMSWRRIIAGCGQDNYLQLRLLLVEVVMRTHPCGVITREQLEEHVTFCGWGPSTT